MRATLVVDPYLQSNKVFDIADKALNRDNCLYPYFCLKRLFEINKVSLDTQDILPVKEADIVIYYDMPQVVPEDSQKSYLIALESEAIKPSNFNVSLHKNFRKVFTYDDRLIDNKKYIKVNYTYDIPTSIAPNEYEAQKLCVLISSNKTSNHHNELYSERLKVIKWFEDNHPDEFDLYGMGWDHFRTGDFFGKLVNKLPKVVDNMLKTHFSTYKGRVFSKLEVLRKYRFSICYENVRDIPGYITEKIFDSLFSGCIPVYWGANNVEKYVPKECFVDKRNFQDIDDLYEYMFNFSKSDYLNFVEKLNSYIKSRNINTFDANIFAKTVFNDIFKDY